MATFMIEIPHTEHGCQNMLSQMAQENPELFSQVCWGCMANDHVGWGMVEADSETEVRNLLPDEVHESARIIEVNKFTADDLKRMRES